MASQNYINQTQVDEYRYGQSIKAIVLDRNPSRILVELADGLTGIITKKEATGDGVDTSDIEVGSEVQATVIEPETEHGLVALSFRRASQDQAWAELNTILEETRNIKVKIYEANKGGLMAKYKGIRAFIPVSQLMPNNYPRVDGADSSMILGKLQSFTGKEFVVRVITVDRESGKVIMSEKQAYEEKIKETLGSINVGDRVEGTVSGIVKFGIFVTFGGVEGLVHLSELDWGHVSNPGALFEIDQKVEVLIIGKERDKLSFSIKQLSSDPWMDKVKGFMEGEQISGPVTRWNDNGVFIEAAPDVQAFISISQFDAENAAELSEKVKEGQEIKGMIKLINQESHRLELTMLD